MAVKTLILGHSFVSRFKAFLREHQGQFSYSLNLSPQQCMVQYAGYPGGMVPGIRSGKLETVSDFEPQLIVLDLGTNDLCNPANTPDSVAQSLYILSKHLIHTMGVKTIVVMQILHHCRPSRPVRYPVNVEWFNDRVDQTNRLLHVLFSKEGLVFWKHKGLWEENALRQAILPDGVHLSAGGYRKYFKNIRAAVVSAKKSLQAA